MKLMYIEKATAMLLVVFVVSASVSSLKDFTVFTESSYLFLSLLGLGLIALGRLRRT